VNNSHVVDHAKTVQVVTDDGKILTANVFSAYQGVEDGGMKCLDRVCARL
jgi:hypothetical protein